jgi:2OG-Fe(II) oxygenase superfamily
VTRFTIDDAAFSPDEVQALRDAALASRLLGKSVLKGAFEATRGFGVRFRRGARADVEARFPAFAPFLARATARERIDAVRAPRPLHLVDRTVGANAFYLNLLVVPPGAGVGRHVDATLGPDDPRRAVTPRAVAVLYLDVPPGGGRLLLFDGDAPAGIIEPRAGRLVHFDGTLGHEVEAVANDAPGPRVSLVCELYSLGPLALRQVPRLHVQGRGFEDVLARLRSA